MIKNVMLACVAVLLMSCSKEELVTPQKANEVIPRDSLDWTIDVSVPSLGVNYQQLHPTRILLTVDDFGQPIGRFYQYQIDGHIFDVWYIWDTDVISQFTGRIGEGTHTFINSMPVTSGTITTINVCGVGQGIQAKVTLYDESNLVKGIR